MIDHPLAPKGAEMAIDLESEEYRTYHATMVAAIRAAMEKRWPPRTASERAQINENVQFFNRECTYDQEFAEGVDPIENAEDQIDAAL